jgi:hypothetical protein
MPNPFEDTDADNQYNTGGAGDDLEYNVGDLEYNGRKNQDYLDDDDDDDEQEKLILARKCCNNRISSSSTHLGLAIFYWVLALYLKFCCVSDSSSR